MPWRTVHKSRPPRDRTQHGRPPTYVVPSTTHGRLFLSPLQRSMCPLDISPHLHLCITASLHHCATSPRPSFVPPRHSALHALLVPLSPAPDHAPPTAPLRCLTDTRRHLCCPKQCPCGHSRSGGAEPPPRKRLRRRRRTQTSSRQHQHADRASASLSAFAAHRNRPKRHPKGKARTRRPNLSNSRRLNLPSNTLTNQPHDLGAALRISLRFL